MKVAKKILIGAIVAQSCAFAAKPNVVVILADDLGPGDVSFYNQKIYKKKPLVKTPTIDALAEDGWWFTDGHSSTSLCAPTRYCVMTGNHAYRSYQPWGVWNTFGQSAITDNDTTLGRIGKKAGMATAFVGKWHLGADYEGKKKGGVFRGRDAKASPDDIDLSKIMDKGPQSMGFDYSFSLPCGIQGPVYTAYENGKLSPFNEKSEVVYLDEKSAKNPKDVSDKGPGPGDSHWNAVETGPLLASKASGFIKKHAGKKPFLLYYCSPMVHIPHVPPKEFNGKKVLGETPTHHLDMVIDLDQQVAAIVNAVKEAGEYENTLFIFISDNGGLNNSSGVKHDSSGEWTGFKNSYEEGGHRIPFIVTWPGKIKGGKISDELVVAHDVVATAAAAVGVKLKKDEAKDSLNLLPQLFEEKDAYRRDSLCLQSGSRTELMYRKGPWKLTIDTDYGKKSMKLIALHNLEEDKTESKKTNKVEDPAFAELRDEMYEEYKEIVKSGKRTVPYEK